MAGLQFITGRAMLYIYTSSKSNIGPHDLPDMYTSALRFQAYTSGKSLIPMLQLYIKQQYNIIKSY